jgi:hypothetical protein
MQIQTFAQNSFRDSIDITVTRQIRHPEFNSDTLQNDICLLMTKDDIAYSKRVQPICTVAQDRV